MAKSDWDENVWILKPNLIEKHWDDVVDPAYQEPEVRQDAGILDSAATPEPPDIDRPDGPGVNMFHEQLILRDKFFCTTKAAGLKPKRIVDVGCGSGRIVRDLSNAYWQGPYLGLDIREQDFIHGGRPRRTSFVRTDFTKAKPWPLLPGTVEYINCCEVIEHLPREDSASLIGKMIKSLAPGGRLVATLPVNRPSYSDEEDLRRFGHYTFWNAAELIERLGKHGEVQAWSSIALNNKVTDAKMKAWIKAAVGPDAVAAYEEMKLRYNPAVAKQLWAWVLPLEEAMHLQFVLTKG